MVRRCNIIPSSVQSGVLVYLRGGCSLHDHIEYLRLDYSKTGLISSIGCYFANPPAASSRMFLTAGLATVYRGAHEPYPKDSHWSPACSEWRNLRDLECPELLKEECSANPTP
jgi:hypothetical protein